MWIELVTTVMPGTSMSWCARAWVVVPALIAMADPGSISSAAAAAIARFSACWRAIFAANLGSYDGLSATRVAPP